MQARKLFKKGPNGTYTLCYLNDNSLNHNFISFQRIVSKVEPEDSIWIGIYQLENGIINYYDKLVFSKFKAKYIEGEAVICFEPNSQVFMAIQIKEGNNMVLLADEGNFNYDQKLADDGKLDYSEMPEFEFELFYELLHKDVRSSVKS